MPMCQTENWHIMYHYGSVVFYLIEDHPKRIRDEEKENSLPDLFSRHNVLKVLSGTLLSLSSSLLPTCQK